MRGWLVVASLLLPALLVGCGGGSSVATKPPGTGGTVVGQLTGASNPENFSIYVDGNPIAATPAPDGSFRILNLPPGRHTVGLIADSGMMGGYTVVEVEPGETTDAGEIIPAPGGQIAGMVMKQEADGSLTPLAGVEVLADPQVYVIMGGAVRPEIYPPPPRDPRLVQYKAITDERGSYLIPAVQPGDYVVTVSVPGLVQGMQWVYVEAGHTAVADFQLQEAVEPGVGTVQGIVQGKNSDGELVPLEGALVTITVSAPWEPIRPDPLPVSDLPSAAQARLMAKAQQAGGGGQGPSGGDGAVIVPPPYFFQQFQTLTDARGHYSLNVPSGHLTIEVWMEGYNWVSEPITVQPRETLTKDFVLEPWEIVEPPQPEPSPEPGPEPLGPDGGSRP